MNKFGYFKVGVDIGGTFTDIVILGSDGSIATKKVSSTPEDYSIAIITGVQQLFKELNLHPDNIKGFIHASTVATNTILENKGAKTALITSKGFRDVLEMRRTRIPQLYNLFYDKPAPLSPRRLRFEVDERMGPRGEVWRPLSEDSVRSVLEKVKAADVEALAICLLHSYANPDHERIITDAAKKMLPNVFVTCSYDILPEIREYERTSTTVINAYVGPKVEKYLYSLKNQLKKAGINAPLQVTQSAGGVMTAESAMTKPAHIVESGPAAGVIAAKRVAKMIGYPDVITLDMGGTTAKAAIIENGEVVTTNEYEVGSGINISSKLVVGGGYSLKLPFVDVSEIGAGGDSIVSIDSGGLLKVGPQSAGSIPGPVCYDIGGEDPTFTDAALALGYLNPCYLAGGQIKLNAEKARRVLQEKVASPLHKNLLETAHGIYTIACTNMIRAVKAVSTYRGRDPRDFVLFAFGGNGPVVAVEIAKSLEIKRVVVPPSTGVFSALGLLYSETQHEFSQTYFCKINEASVAELNNIVKRLEDQAKTVLAEEDFPAERMIIERYADMRYSGQSYELSIPIKEGCIDECRLAEMEKAFSQEHLKVYGHAAENDPIDIVNLKVIGRASLEVEDGCVSKTGLNADIKPSEKFCMRAAYFGLEHGLIETPVIAREDLFNKTMAGPIIIEEYDSTSVIPPGCTANLDSWGNIVIEVNE